MVVHFAAPALLGVVVLSRSKWFPSPTVLWSRWCISLGNRRNTFPLRMCKVVLRRFFAPVVIKGGSAIVISWLFKLASLSWRLGPYLMKFLTLVKLGPYFGIVSLPLVTLLQLYKQKKVLCSSSILLLGPYLSLQAKSTKISPTAAVVNDATTIPSDYTEEQTSLQSGKDNDASHEEWRKKDREREHQEGPSNHEYQKMIRVCNKLIEVFMVDKPTTTDWRRLLAFSREWSNIRPHFFRRCEEQAASEQDPDMRHKLLRLGRKMMEIDEDVQKHNELLEMIKGAPSEISSVVAKRRNDFTKEFFMHLHDVAESYYDNPTEQNNLAKLGNTCLAAVQAYDTASESIEALNTAELKFQDIINSPTLDAACKKIDALAEKKELDSALMLMLTKAYSASKESNMMKDEVKDILYHLYMTGLGNLQRNIPKEIRIVKYILTIEDPEEKLCALKDAFTPGIELEGKNVDNLYTTPEKLYTWIRTVLDAYQFSREGSLIREARDLMNPKIIKKLEELKKLVENSFM